LNRQPDRFCPRWDIYHPEITGFFGGAGGALAAVFALLTAVESPGSCCLFWIF
jgi:hypothetical protein